MKIKDAEITVNEIIKSIDKATDKDRFKILESMTKMNNVLRQKWTFITSMRLLAKNDLSEGDLFALLSECDNFRTRLLKEIRKHQNDMSKARMQ